MARFSLEDWEFGAWLKGFLDMKFVKETVKFAIPAIALWFTTGSYWLTAPGTIVGKAILDLLHYWVKE
jgi:hypothetical protein